MSVEEEVLKELSNPKYKSFYLNLAQLFFIVILLIFLLVFVVPKGFWISLEKVITYHKDIKPDTEVKFVGGENIRATNYRVETTGENTEVFGFVGKVEGDVIYEYKESNDGLGNYEVIDICWSYRNCNIQEKLREIEYKPLPERFNLRDGAIVIVAPTKDNGTVTLFGTGINDTYDFRTYWY